MTLWIASCLKCRSKCVPMILGLNTTGIVEGSPCPIVSIIIVELILAAPPLIKQAFAALTIASYACRHLSICEALELP